MIGFMLLAFGFLAGVCFVKELYFAAVLCIAMFLLIKKAGDYIDDKL